MATAFQASAFQASPAFQIDAVVVDADRAGDVAWPWEIDALKRKYDKQSRDHHKKSRKSKKDTFKQLEKSIRRAMGEEPLIAPAASEALRALAGLELQTRDQPPVALFDYVGAALALAQLSRRAVVLEAQYRDALQRQINMAIAELIERENEEILLLTTI